MLNKTGKINQRAHKKLPLPWEAFKYLYHQLHFKQPDVRPSKVVTKIRNPITLDNLTLSVAQTITTKYTLFASNIIGFDAMRCFISRVGLGVKKRHPKLSTINSHDGSNKLTVQEQDTIHIVDVDANSVLYRNSDEYGSDSDASTDQPTNWIRLSYDYVTKHIGITIKCYTTVVSLLSPDSRHYLHDNNIVSRASYVFYDGRLMKVLSVDRTTNETILCDPNNEHDTATVTNDYADQNSLDA